MKNMFDYFKKLSNGSFTLEQFLFSSIEYGLVSNAPIFQDFRQLG